MKNITKLLFSIEKKHTIGYQVPILFEVIGTRWKEWPAGRIQLKEHP